MGMAEKVFIGVDVGGTKISAGLVTQSGRIRARKKCATPRAGQKETLRAIAGVIEETLAKGKGAKPDGIGIGVPGIVDVEKGKVLITPNADLSETDIVRELEKTFKVKVVLGNDVNLGVLGEKWLGIARETEDVVGFFPGTGVGGGVIIEGKLLTGAHGAGAELGHIVMSLDGPQCSCGNRGCLEAFVGRWAIERDLREAVQKGERTVLTELTGGKLDSIKSRLLRDALRRKDPLVTRVMKRASEILGLACVSVRHAFDPELIVFGGGVIEACGDFILPIVRKVCQADPFFAKIGKCEVVRSVLGDDATMLGAVATVQSKLGIQLGKGSIYPVIELAKSGKMLVDGEVCQQSVHIRADGRVKKWKKLADESAERVRKLGPEELERLCKKRPEVLILGSAEKRGLQVSKEGEEFLEGEGIELKVLDTQQAVQFYNETPRRKAAAILVNP